MVGFLDGWARIGSRGPARGVATGDRGLDGGRLSFEFRNHPGLQSAGTPAFDGGWHSNPSL